MTDARKRAEEALAFMDAALRDEMPPLPTQVKALADAVRALLAAGPEAVCTPGCACGAPHEPDDEDPCACPCHEPDGTPASSDAAVREAAEALTVYCHVCEADRREPCVTVTTGDPAPYPHPERAVAAALAARGGE